MLPGYVYWEMVNPASVHMVNQSCSYTQKIHWELWLNLSNCDNLLADFRLFAQKRFKCFI